MRTSKIRILALFCALTLAAGLFAGCSSSTTEEESTSKPFQLLVMAPHVLEENVAALGETLMAEVPALAEEEDAPLFTAMTMGSSETDPSVVITSNAQVVGLAADQAVNVVVADVSTATRFAANGFFTPLSEVFTEEELQDVQDRLMTLPLLDDEGNETDESTEVMGIDVSQSETLRTATGQSSVGVFFVNTGNHTELAKEVFLALADIQ